MKESPLPPTIIPPLKISTFSGKSGQSLDLNRYPSMDDGGTIPTSNLRLQMKMSMADRSKSLDIIVRDRDESEVRSALGSPSMSEMSEDGGEDHNSSLVAKMSFLESPKKSKKKTNVTSFDGGDNSKDKENVFAE